MIPGQTPAQRDAYATEMDLLRSIDAHAKKSREYLRNISLAASIFVVLSAVGFLGAVLALLAQFAR